MSVSRSRNRPSSYYVVDGYDLREELHRLIRLDTFAGTGLADDPPELEIVRYSRHVRRHGFAEGGHKIKINVGTNVDRFNLQETLAHELTHVYFARANRAYVSHSSTTFWLKLDRVIREAYGEHLTFAPRTNRYHGRYAEALRRDAQHTHEQTLVDRLTQVIDEVGSALDIDRQTGLEIISPEIERELTDTEKRFLAGTLVDEPYERTDPIGWDHIPQPLTNAPEPRQSYLPLEIVYPAPRNVPATSRRRLPLALPESGRARSVELDERVYDVIRRHPGSERYWIDRLYTRNYGEPYPGASTYNSIWRLKKAGRVYRLGHHWYAH